MASVHLVRVIIDEEAFLVWSWYLTNSTCSNHLTLSLWQNLMQTDISRFWPETFLIIFYSSLQVRILLFFVSLDVANPTDRKLYDKLCQYYFDTIFQQKFISLILFPFSLTVANFIEAFYDEVKHRLPYLSTTNLDTGLREEPYGKKSYNVGSQYGWRQSSSWRSQVKLDLRCQMNFLRGQNYTRLSKLRYLPTEAKKLS